MCDFLSLELQVPSTMQGTERRCPWDLHLFVEVKKTYRVFSSYSFHNISLRGKASLGLCIRRCLNSMATNSIWVHRFSLGAFLIKPPALCFLQPLHHFLSVTLLCKSDPLFSFSRHFERIFKCIMRAKPFPIPSKTPAAIRIQTIYLKIIPYGTLAFST